MSDVTLIFPHQLFKELWFENRFPVYLIEEWLFFNQYPFHKQKIVFHRASMKHYADWLTNHGYQVVYIEAQDSRCDVRALVDHLRNDGVKTIHYQNTIDDWLNKRLKRSAKKNNIQLNESISQLFINSQDKLNGFFRRDKKKFYQTSFYIDQRKKLNILTIDGDKPIGGKWSFDKENRKKYPKGKVPPPIQFPETTTYYKEATQYTIQHFSENLGSITEHPLYPVTHDQAETWLQQFFKVRFAEFGPYEDAIVDEYSILNHSVLSPLINVGLLTPMYVVRQAIKHADSFQTPLNSLEGFVRQIIGWREFIRGVYICKGVEERTKNFWGFERKIPASFYNGTTGIIPIDKTIQKVLKTGYCHHIERLMILGNFMVLCEFHPDAVYQWFMELFIDAYDWVMVPNVYGMSQFADGGLMSTKPYISGSNYIMKMSNYKKGAWQAIWDGLFWRFMHVNADFFKSNPRLNMLVRSFERMSEEKRNQHLSQAESFLNRLDNELV